MGTLMALLPGKRCHIGFLCLRGLDSSGLWVGRGYMAQRSVGLLVACPPRETRRRVALSMYRLLEVAAV